jgi:hypothetical protein
LGTLKLNVLLPGDERYTSTPYNDTRNLNTAMTSLRNHALSAVANQRHCIRAILYSIHVPCTDIVLCSATNHHPESEVLPDTLTGPFLQGNTNLAKRFQQQQTYKQTNNFVVADFLNRKSRIPVSYSGGASSSVGSKTGWSQDFLELL